jgi:hypothetical protein
LRFCGEGRILGRASAVEMEGRVKLGALGQTGVVSIDSFPRHRFQRLVDRREVQEGRSDQEAQAPRVATIADPHRADEFSDELAIVRSGSGGDEGKDGGPLFAAGETEVVVDERQ